MTIVDFEFFLAAYPELIRGPTHEREGFVPPGPALAARTAEQLRRAAEEGRKFELQHRTTAASHGRLLINAAEAVPLEQLNAAEQEVNTGVAPEAFKLAS